MRQLFLFLIILTITAKTFGQSNVKKEWPDIPLLEIVTIDSIMPTATLISAPEGCIGTSITNNEYVTGRMTISLKGDTIYDTDKYVKNVSGMKIKIRGNSSGAYLKQHPYKIKLTKKYDLLRRNDKRYKHKEWLLLSMYTWNVTMTNQESNILNIAGLLVSKILNKEWTPEYELVNVVLNGEYQGMYYLMESVEKGEGRVNIDDTGFLIENDTFWWNENVYFKTDRQIYETGYTWKYPDNDDVNDSIQAIVKTYMNEFEQALYTGSDLSQYISLESFAKWILIHDILGTDDAAGCNKFICKRDMDDTNYSSSLLETGPVWDFDSMFRIGDQWSILHSSDWYYYTLLFNRKDFIQTYLNLWNQIRPTIITDIEKGFDEVWQKYGSVFDKNMKLHQTVYPNEGQQSFKSQIDEVTYKLKDRIALLDKLIEEYSNIDNVEDINNTNQYKPISVIDILGHKYHPTYLKRLPKGLYIINYTNGKTRKYIKRKNAGD